MRGKAIYSLGGAILQLLMRLMRFSLRKFVETAEKRPAYEIVWKSRYRLGWTRDKYSCSLVWQNVRRQTREFLPALFRCEEFHASDCTESSY